MDDLLFKRKYLKYKRKYEHLVNKTGGGETLAIKLTDEAGNLANGWEVCRDNLFTLKQNNNLQDGKSNRFYFEGVFVQDENDRNLYTTKQSGRTYQFVPLPFHNDDESLASLFPMVNVGKTNELQVHKSWKEDPQKVGTYYCQITAHPWKITIIQSHHIKLLKNFMTQQKTKLEAFMTDKKIPNEAPEYV